MQFYVDGSFDDDKHISSYGVIVVNNNKVIDILYNVCTNEEYLKHRNVYGEVLGTLCAIKYAQINNIFNIEIFHDYIGICKWCLGLSNVSNIGKSWKQNYSLSKNYRQYISQCGINITFNKVKSHSGNKYNDMADKYAKKAIMEYIPSQH